jgi:hypothetical protein
MGVSSLDFGPLAIASGPFFFPVSACGTSLSAENRVETEIRDRFGSLLIKPCIIMRGGPESAVDHVVLAAMAPGCGGFTIARRVTCFTAIRRGSGYRRSNAVLGVLLEAAMATLARMLSRASGFEIDVETLRPIVIFCGAGLLFALMLLSYGVDLSPGFF